MDSLYVFIVCIHCMYSLLVYSSYPFKKLESEKKKNLDHED